MAIRSITEEEFPEWELSSAYGFGEHSNEARKIQIRGITELERTFGAFNDGKIVGTASTHSLEITIPGRVLDLAYVDGVAVLPTHRRKGILTKLTKHQFNDMRDHGEAIAGLTASESSIYERYGYGISSWSENWSIQREHSKISDQPKVHGGTRFVEAPEVREIWPRIYNRIRPTRPGLFNYTTEWWNAFASDPEHWRGGSSEMFHVVYERGNGPEGLVSYSIRSDFPVTSKSAVIVIMLLGTTSQVERELWRYCFGIDLMASVVARNRPVDDQLPWILSDTRKLDRSIHDHLWIRLVDASVALSSRTYASHCDVVLNVIDPMCTWNHGRFEIETSQTGARYKPTKKSPHLSLPISDLAAVYLGGTTFAMLHRAGRIEQHQKGAIRALDKAFATERSPWTLAGF